MLCIPYCNFLDSNNSILWLLDNGQGGFIDSTYQSPDKQSPPLPNGEILYEGLINRDIVQRIATKCQQAGIHYMILVPTPNDLSDEIRARKANEIYREHPNCILLSIRLNKKKTKNQLQFSHSQGISTYYYKQKVQFWIWNQADRRERASRGIALIFLRFLECYTGLKKRGLKKLKHDLLSKTRMPAIICRNGFLNNDEDCKKLLSEQFREEIATAYFEAIRFINNKGQEGIRHADSLELPLSDSMV